MDLEAMLTVFYAILLSTMGLGDAQMAFPKVAQGKNAVARVFRGAPFGPATRSRRTHSQPYPCMRAKQRCIRIGRGQCVLCFTLAVISY